MMLSSRLPWGHPRLLRTTAANEICFKFIIHKAGSFLSQSLYGTVCLPQPSLLSVLKLSKYMPCLPLEPFVTPTNQLTHYFISIFVFLVCFALLCVYINFKVSELFALIHTHTFLYFLITILTNWTCPQVAS